MCLCHADPTSVDRVKGGSERRATEVAGPRARRARSDGGRRRGVRRQVGDGIDEREDKAEEQLGGAGRSEERRKTGAGLNNVVEYCCMHEHVRLK